MTDTLYRLAYYSLNALPSGEDTEVEVRRILEVSRRNNAKAGITGALLYTNGCFAQILEGDYAAVERTFETIQNDERHTAIVPLQFEKVSARGFGPWSMAYVGTDENAIAETLGLARAEDFYPARCDGAELFKVLHGVLLAQERGAAMGVHAWTLT